MNKTQTAILERALKSLSGDTGSPEVQAALADPHLKLYLDTWVRPLIAGVIAASKGEITTESIKFWVR